MMKNLWRAMVWPATVAVLFGMASLTQARDRKHQDAAAKEQAQRRMAGLSVSGEVLTIGSDKVVIRGDKGGQSEFLINATTQYGKDKGLSLGDFKKGDKIMVIYDQEDGARLARVLINVNTLASKSSLKHGVTPEEEKRKRK